MSEAGLEVTDRGSGSSAGTTYREAHGVFVGAGDVEGLCPLAGPANDVDALTDALSPSLGTMSTLVGEAATRENILESLEDTVHRARSGDLVIAYFGGRGAVAHRDLYLLPADGGRAGLLETGVSLTLASAVLSSGPGVMSLIILDVSNAAAVGFDMSRYRPGSESGLMLATASNQLAQEVPMEDGKDHGLFSWSLVQALRAHQTSDDGWKLSLIDWFDDAYERLVQRSVTHGVPQVPLFLGTLSPNLELRARRRTDPPATRREHSERTV